MVPGKFRLLAAVAAILWSGMLAAADFTDSMNFDADRKTAAGGRASANVTADGGAAVLRDNGVIVYDQVTLNNASGELSFRIRLDFDERSDDPRLKNVLRNQIFLTLARSDRNYASVYTADGLRFGVFSPRGEVLFLLGARSHFEKGVWYDVAIQWGRKVQMLIDGKVVAEKEHDGLWGSLPAADTATLRIGREPGYGIVNEFSIDDLKLISGDTERVAAAVPSIPGATAMPVIDRKSVV